MSVLHGNADKRMQHRSIFITGGTGYIGRPLITELLQRGHTVRALVRNGSESRLPPGVEAMYGNALDAATFTSAVPPSDTIIHLVGTPHPNPSKAAAFERVDLASIQASVQAATASGSIRQFIYLSVAQPAPVMQAYIAVRQKGEELIRNAGLNATMVRPWYVLGPGHRWPYILLPLYWLARQLPLTRDSAKRLGLVTLRQMVVTLVNAVENPVTGVRIVDAEVIRACFKSPSLSS
jgi:uncharacterized protein YbjT (DUF2867 family)